MKAKKKSLPTKAILGFVELSGRSEALSFARDAARHFFVSVEEATVHVIPYGDGYVYEAHESGGGKGHMISALRLLASGKEMAWFPVYQRVASLQIVDGRPVGLLLSRDQAVEVMQHRPDCKAMPTDPMTAVVPKGERTMAVGMTMAACGVLALGGALAYDAATQIGRHPTSLVEISDLPFRQWGLVENTPIGLFVESLRYDATLDPDRRWSVSRRPVDRETPTAATPSAPVSPTTVATVPSVETPVATPPATTAVADPAPTTTVTE